MNEQGEILTTSEWWGQRRFRYNVGLVISGLLAFIAYASIVFTFEERIPDAEISGFTTIFQAVGYLVAMGIANICYFLGPISERLLKPSDVATFRRNAYNLGFWFSVLLPFSIPVLVGYVVFKNA